MKVNPLKKLQEAREANVEENKNLISEVQLLLDNAGQEEREALRIAGLEQHVVHVENTRGVEIERRKFEEEYASSSFTQDEVKNLCLKYDLRMLPTRLFTGKLDGIVASKLKAFVNKHKSEIGHHSDNFYIIAPPKAFMLEDQPAKPRRIDPILLYKVPGAHRTSRTEQYILIHKWGKDFTLYRRLLGMKYKSLMSLRIFWSLLLTVVTASLVAIAHNPISLWSYLFIPVTFLSWFSMSILLYYMEADEIASTRKIERKLGKFTTKDLWNSTSKRTIFR